MAALPSGQVTFLFTDIEGSTPLQEQLGDLYEIDRRFHDALVRRVIERHDGHVLKDTGDGFFAAFADAGAGVRACIEAQRELVGAQWPRGERLLVRMGLHTADATPTAGDYHGPPVSMAARVGDAGHGDQIVVSTATRELALSDDWGYEWLGEHWLKGIRAPAVLHQVVASNLRADFPPLRPRAVVNHNLPPLRAPLVGRDADFATLSRVLAADRHIALVGDDGIGKTSLAIAVAERVSPRYRAARGGSTSRT